MTAATVTVDKGANCQGKRVRALRLPDGARLISVVRAGKAEIPDEETQLEVGDLVAILDAGAYGSAMASNYNRRPLPPEVLVDEGAWRLIRRRQTIDDMLMLEQ